MTALVINCIIGSGIFGLPGELTRLLGRASPVAMICGAAMMAVIIACFAEVASQFNEPGGPYLYARTAFGRFVGMQIGWVELLSVMTGLAALSTLFADYLSTLLPKPLIGSERALLLAFLIGTPMAANILGVRSGARLNNIATLAKLSPLLLLVILGMAHYAQHPQMMNAAEIASPGIRNWIRAMVFVVFSFGGWEDSVVPTGEIKDPRRTIAFGLGMALALCAAIYAVLQFITVVIVGGATTAAAPLADTASVLLGTNGAKFVALAAMVSTYGWITGAMLYGPRLAYSLGAQGDFPAVFARLNPRFHTPALAILFYGFAGWLLAASGTFLWLVAIGAGTMLIEYAVTCAALIRLRKTRRNAAGLRIPFGRGLSLIAIAMSLAFMAGLKRGEVLVMGITAVLAAGNWVLVTQRHKIAERARARTA